MRFVQLRAFHYVAIHAGFSRAAQVLNVTQPAISDHVRKLEAEYDVSLFDRHKKQIALTEQGKQLLEITHRLFDIEQLARDYLSESRALRTGTLRLVVDSAHHVMNILSIFREQYPGVFVSVRVGNSAQVLDSLSSYAADIGVLGEIPENRQFKILPLNSTSIIAFAPAASDYAELTGVTLLQLSKMPLVLREPGSKTRAKIEQHAAACGVQLRIDIEAEGREAVRDIVAAGGGVGIVSEAEIADNLNFIQIPIVDSQLTMDEAIVCLRDRQHSRLIQAFMAIAETTLKL